MYFRCKQNLAEHSLFCIKDNGSIRSQKRLDYHPACLTTYPVEEGSKGYYNVKMTLILLENIFHNLIVGTHDSNIKIYRDNALIWNAGLAFIPVSLFVATIADIAGMIVVMDDVGHLIVSYLGTDPATNVVNVQAENKEFNYDDMDEELKRLQMVIREATTCRKSFGNR
jgi:Bardet-Biedl syndrome 9 protein